VTSMTKSASPTGSKKIQKRGRKAPFIVFSPLLAGQS